jgi:hypothetical protein
MQATHKIEIPEQKGDAEIALAIHYLDPEFDPKENGEDDGTVLGIVISWVTWLTGTLTYICLYMRTLWKCRRGRAIFGRPGEPSHG